MFWYHQHLNWIAHSILSLFILALSVWFLIKKNFQKQYIASRFRAVCQLANSGVGTTLLTGLSITWASYVSLYAVDLRSQLGNLAFQIESIIFTLTILLALCIAIFKELGSQIQAKETEGRIKEEYAALPPRSIIILISNCTITHFKQTSELKTLVTEMYEDGAQEAQVFDLIIESIENAVQQVIKDILNATIEWDNESNSKITYHVNFFHALGTQNILADYENGKLDERTLNSITSSPFFLYSDSIECKLKNCEYLLLGTRRYSTCNEDQNNSPICMPFSSKTFEDSKELTQPNLSGAPNSLYIERCEHIGDTVQSFKNFRNELEDSGHLDLTKRYLNGLKDYYSNDNAKSLLSIPIERHLKAHSLDKQTSQSYAGVLNIYANKKQMFKSQQKADAFHAIMTPLLYNLATLISMQIEVANHRLANTVIVPIALSNPPSEPKE
ncbi:hypothetical protein AB4508_20510 [Vibrio splendidus]